VGEYSESVKKKVEEEVEKSIIIVRRKEMVKIKQSNLKRLKEVQQSIKSLKETLNWMEREERHLQHILKYEVERQFAVQKGKYGPVLCEDKVIICEKKEGV